MIQKCLLILLIYVTYAKDLNFSTQYLNMNFNSNVFAYYILITYGFKAAIVLQKRTENRAIQLVSKEVTAT